MHPRNSRAPTYGFFPLVAAVAAFLFATRLVAAEPAEIRFGDALQAGRIAAKGAAPQSHELQLTLVNLGDEPLVVLLDRPLLAIPASLLPKSTPEKDSASKPQKNASAIPQFAIARPAADGGLDPNPAKSNQKTLREAQSLESEIVGEQPLLAGPLRDRGGLVGSQAVPLAAKESRRVDLPVWRTRIGKFHPTPGAKYTVLPAEEAAADPHLKLFCRWASQEGVSWGTAQAALWQLAEPVRPVDLKMLKGREVNDSEWALAEQLLADLRDAQASGRDPEPKLPAKVYLQLVNRQGDLGLPMSKRLGTTARNGGLFGLPVERAGIDDARLGGGAELALACGCQLSLMQSGESSVAGVLLRFWDGRSFEPQREFRVWLGKQPAAEAAIRHIESGVYNEMISLDRLADDSSSPRLEIANRFPWAIHRLVLVERDPGPEGPDELVLDDLAIGPRRTVRLPLDLHPTAWKIDDLVWGF